MAEETGEGGATPGDESVPRPGITEDGARVPENPDADASPGPGGRLDPDDWSGFRETAHDVLDDLIDYLGGIRERPVWRPVPGEVRARVGTEPPSEPAGLEAAWEEAREAILPHPVGNIHPRFFGWVHGTGTPGGIVAEMIAATMNSNVGGRDHGAVYVERQVVDWWRQILGLPEGTSGIVTTGTSMATLTALTVARNRALDRDVREEGLGPGGHRLRAYMSAQTHGCVTKAMEVLGLGGRAVVEVPVDEGYRVDVDALERRVARDRERDLVPFCVVGNAGTVNTGALDDLDALADVCRRQDLWLHVDGAFGAMAALSDDLRPRLSGIARADSVAFDFHKWLHVPYDAGCVLVRQGDEHRAAFAAGDAYLRRDEGGVGGGAPWFTDYGVELSRGFRALKVWMTMVEHGTRRIGRAVERNCEQAAYLARRIDADPALERRAPVPLNVVCFRYTGRDGAPPLSGGPGPRDAVGDQDRSDRGDALDDLNRRILRRLHREGTAAPSSTRLDGRLVLRVALTNHRTVEGDLDLLLERVTAIGDALCAEGLRGDA